MKIKHTFISFCFILVCLNIYADNSLSFRACYDSIYADIHFRYFTKSDYSFTQEDYQAVESLYNLNSVDNHVNRAKTEYLEAFIRSCDILPDSEKIISLVENALSVLTQSKYPKEYARLLIVKGIAYVNTGNYYAEAYHCFNQALTLLADDEDKPFVGLIYNYMAIMWLNLDEYQNGLESIEKAEKIFQDAGYEFTAFFVRSNRYNIYTRTGESKEIMPSIKKDMEWAVAQKDTTSAVYLNILLGNCYVLVEDWNNAYLYLSKASDLIEEYSTPSSARKVDVYYSLGKLFYFRKDYQKAIGYFQKALPYIRQLNLLNYEGKANYYLSKIHDYYGDKKSAYSYLLQFVELNDSLSIQEKAMEINKIKSHSELINYQQLLQITQQEARIERVNALVIILILLLILFVIVFLLFYVNRKKMRLNQLLENKEIANKLEKLQLEKQMEEKQREIVTTQLLTAEKTKVLQQMIELFKPYYVSKEISEDIWNKLQSFVSSSEWKENEWEKSKLHFERVHPDFFKKLKSLCPELTENDLRLCAYTRIGMRNKEIAEMLSIDQKSVISNRYHLKKKLQLPKEQSLDDFIRDV